MVKLYIICSTCSLHAYKISIKIVKPASPIILSHTSLNYRVSGVVFYQENISESVTTPSASCLDIRQKPCFRLVIIFKKTIYSSSSRSLGHDSHTKPLLLPCVRAFHKKNIYLLIIFVYWFRISSCIVYIIQCSPCKSNPDTTNFLLIRRFLESRHIYNTKNSNDMSCIIRSRVSLVYVHTREYQSFLITCVRLCYLRRPRSWG